MWSKGAFLKNRKVIKKYRILLFIKSCFKKLKTLNTLGFILGHFPLLSQGIRDFFLFNSWFNC
ncbi:conserved hypothetical protein [Bacillus pseudomycoides]